MGETITLEADIKDKTSPSGFVMKYKNEANTPAVTLTNSPTATQSGDAANNLVSYLTNFYN